MHRGPYSSPTNPLILSAYSAATNADHTESVLEETFTREIRIRDSGRRIVAKTSILLDYF
jgi:hypothetical protein